MLFCENCNFVTEEEYCPVCGRKKLRQVTDEDFCFLTESRTPECERILEIFKENGIECVAMPFRSGLAAKFAMPLTNFRLFVRYAKLEEANEIIKAVR